MTLSVLGVTFGALAALLGVVLQLGASAIGITFVVGVIVLSLFFNLYKKKFPFHQPSDELKAWVPIGIGYVVFFFLGGWIVSLVLGLLRGMANT